MAEPIKIHFQTSADTQAGQEVANVTRDVGAAVDSLTSATTTSGGTLPITVQVQEAAEAIGDAAQGAADLAEVVGEDLTDALDDAAGGADDLGENVAQIGRAQVAQIASQMAEMFGKLGSGIRDAAEAVREFDPQMAATMEKTGKGIEKVSQAAATMALGAAFGPVGVIAASTAVAVKTLGEEFVDMATASARASAAGHEAAEMQERLNQAIREHDATQANYDRAEVLRAEADAAGELADALARVNRVEAARDSAARKVRDNESAARVRRGADPEEERLALAEDDRRRDLAILDRESKAEMARVKKLEADLQQAQAAAALAEGDSMVPDADKEKARAEVEKAKDNVENAYDEFRANKEIRQTQRDVIESDFLDETDRARYDAAVRKQREDQAIKDGEAKAAAAARRARLEGGLRTAEGRLGAGARDASGQFLSDSRVGGALGGTLAGIGQKLADGTDAKEMAKLAAEFQAATRGMTGPVLANLRAMIEAMNAQAGEIENMKGQIKQLRTGR